MPSTATKYLYTSDDNEEAEYDAAELAKMKEWMADKGLKKYLPLMIQNEVFSLQDLALLNSTDLVEMGMKAVGSRRKLLAHTQHLKTRYDGVGDYSQNGFYVPSSDGRTMAYDSPPKRYQEPTKTLPPIRAGSAGMGRPASAGSKRQGSSSMKQRASPIPGSVDLSEMREGTSETFVQVRSPIYPFGIPMCLSLPMYHITQALVEHAYGFFCNLKCNSGVTLAGGGWGALSPLRLSPRKGVYVWDRVRDHSPCKPTL